MKEMILAKKRENKGFTLMELLIVVAIIAVLVAIAIPMFTAQLEKSREATDMANIRSAYAEAVAAYLDSNEAQTAEVTITSNTSDWKSDESATIAGLNAKSIVNGATGGTVTITVSASGDVKIGGVDVDSSALTTSSSGAGTTGGE